MIVKELFARLGIKFDEDSARRADNRLNGLRESARGLATLFVGGLVTRGFFELVDMASGAAEGLNKLNQVFGESSEEVTNWAATMAAELGRSEIALRDMATGFGAIVEPFLGSEDAAADMSTALAQLAVDMASFNDATEEETFAAIRSGIVGQTEPLLRFGANLQVANLRQVALQQGITKSVESMTMAEKVQLRFAALMEQTAKQQGDAARTAQGWANASKAVRGALTDLAVAAGTVVLPFMEQIAFVVRDGVQGFRDWARDSRILQLVFLALGTIAGGFALILLAKVVAAIAAVATTALSAAAAFSGMGAAALLAQAKVLLLASSFILLLGLLFLIGDEILVALEGGDTLGRRFSEWIGKLFDDFMKFKTTNVILNAMLAIFKALGSAVKFVKDTIFAMILAIKDFDLSGFGISFEDLVKGLKAAGATFFAGDEIPEVETAEALFLPPPTNVTTTTNVGEIVVNAAEGQSEVEVAKQVRRQFDEMVEENETMALQQLVPAVGGATR